MAEKNFVGDLIILRGFPNVGKKTLAKVILQTPDNSETEILAIDSNSNVESVNDCLIKCAERMRQGISRVVVTCVIYKYENLDPFFDMANRYNYKVHSVIVEAINTNQNDGEEISNEFEIKFK